MEQQPRPRLGVSQCLLGARVRYDGGHRLEGFVADTLARHVELVPVCPEVEAGLGTPREPMHLVRTARGLRLRGNHSATDHTAALQGLVDRRLAELTAAGLDGFILKSHSPSCGLAVAVEGSPDPAPGLFAAALTADMPGLVVVEEKVLATASGREDFCIRLFAHARLRDLLEQAWTPGMLAAFHTREKMLLLGQDRTLYDRLGRLVAGAGGRPRPELAREYRSIFLQALAKPATIGHHINVLQHLAGHFRQSLDGARRDMLHRTIDRYRTGAAPRGEVLALLRELADELDLAWVREQSYLAPCPEELLGKH